MDIFEVIDGKHTITGDVVRIVRVEVGRDGNPVRKVLLSNGRTVRIISRDGNMISILTGKGARHERVVGETILSFYINDELVATIGAEDVEKFAV